MDSLSQFALGAAVAQATLGSKLGPRAMLVGGLLGTVPDMDVLVRYSDAVASFTFHRSWSHSLFVLSLASIPIAWLCHRFYPDKWLSAGAGDESRFYASINTSNSASENVTSNVPSYAQWLMCVFLVLITHATLDGFTIYGTQLFWPLNVEPTAIGSIFIVDPLYTVPLLIALLLAFRSRIRAHRVVIAGLVVSTAYLILTLHLQGNVRAIAHASLQQQNLSTENVLVAPTPFSLLWRLVSIDNGTYHEGFYSLLDDDKHIEFVSYNRNSDMINQYSDHWPIARMDWFTGGMISASQVNDQLVINDLRMGIESSYVFRFSVGHLDESGFEPSQSQQMPFELNTARMRALVRRTWDEHINVLP